MDAIALLSHSSPTATVAYRAGVPVTVRQFLSDAHYLAQCLPNSKHVLNVCADRYHFTVGLAASLLSQRVSLLPSTHTPQVIAQLSAFAPDAFCLTDDARCDIELPQVYFPAKLPVAVSSGPQESFRIPTIAAAQLAAIVFTSGSTGVPMPFRKTWGLLARCIQSGAPRLGLVDGRSHAIVGTVPGQHMYGFESTVLLALLSGNAFCAERPFYPADVAAAVHAVPRPRILVTTPIHLRTLLGSEVEFPPLDLVVSATAPLSQALAREVEEQIPRAATGDLRLDRDGSDSHPPHC
jgi:acyl-coenzyme A synthetase/AMP-(fatty) acid ligase